jgi:hypothetical protein
MRSKITYCSDLGFQSGNLFFQDLALLLVGVHLGDLGLEIRHLGLPFGMRFLVGCSSLQSGSHGCSFLPSVSI